MTNAGHDRSRDTSPIDRRTTSTFSSSSKRFSSDSTETAESSSASQRNNHATAQLKEERKHRSHKSRNSGAFLLATEAPAIDTRHDKGKGALREKKHIRDRSGNLAVGGSPLAATVTNADHDGEITTDKLDVDSAQIVNLALNLSESRRNAARRNISTSLPPVGLGFGEGMVGGSLKHHLQQQRRVSRNVSPKPDKGERVASPRIVSGQRIATPLQGSFDSLEGTYRHQFSASTLARAEKAKKEIELMAQYRRLLQHVPPLKPQPPERPNTANTAGTSPISTKFPDSVHGPQLLGREYNPLQYIRNRRLRARERQGIDGEGQGFGDIDQVSSWVDEVAKQASEESEAVDYVSLPYFSSAAESMNASHASHTSPKSDLDKSKPKRPRIDWMVKPADLLADAFWLEQDNNKRKIEDRHGQRVFPQEVELKRPMSKDEEVTLERTLSPEKVATKRPSAVDLRIDTELPDFRSVKPASDRIYDKADRAVSRARHKIRDATHIHHGQNGSVRVHRQFLRARSRSGSDNSDSDSDARPKRTWTDDIHERDRDILEKQMSELLAKEEAEKDAPSIREQQRGQQSTDTPQSARASLEHANGRNDYRTQESTESNDPHRGSSGRPSLEVPGSQTRASLKGLDSITPNSPEAKEPRNPFPGISMDLYSSRRSNRSPLRRPPSRMRSSTRTREQSRDRRRRGDTEEVKSAIERTSSKEQTPDITEKPTLRSRSSSPSKFLTPRTTNMSLNSTTSVKPTSLRRGKVSEPTAGIRGLFKSRGPIAKVSDFLWKKESAPISGLQSGFTTDDSDNEDGRSRQRTSQTRDRSESRAPNSEEASPDVPSYLNEMPKFASPIENRGRRPLRPEPGDDTPLQKDLEPGKNSRGRHLEVTPTFAFHNASPSTSPDGKFLDRSTHRDSDVSDLESVRRNLPKGVHSADARLNAVLGLPGKKPNTLPTTGLSHIETTHNQRPGLGNRQWSISDRSPTIQNGPTNKREIARIRALLLSSGIKAKEISRRAGESQNFHSPTNSTYRGIANLIPTRTLPPALKCQQHIRAAQILSDDIERSSNAWRAEADLFYNKTVQELLDRVDSVQSRIANHLTPMTRKATDEADEVSKDLVTSHTLEVKRLSDAIGKMMRRRQRRFRWLRRGGWVLVEWLLVGVMWYVWAMVVLCRIVLGVGRGMFGGVRWLFWL